MMANTTDLAAKLRLLYITPSTMPLEEAAVLLLERGREEAVLGGTYVQEVPLQLRGSDTLKSLLKAYKDGKGIRTEDRTGVWE